MNIDNTGFPMMSESEVGIIWKLFDTYKPARCLEWGSGNSTLYFPVHHAIEYWLSLEHNGHYVHYLEKKISSKVELKWKHEDIEGYIKYPYQVDPFDFILIDGIHRPECADVAYDIARKNTLVLLHDSARKESKEILDNWKGSVEILCDGEKLLSNGFCAHRGLALLKI